MIYKQERDRQGTAEHLWLWGWISYRPRGQYQLRIGRRYLGWWSPQEEDPRLMKQVREVLEKAEAKYG